MCMICNVSKRESCDSFRDLWNIFLSKRSVMFFIPNFQISPTCPVRTLLHPEHVGLYTPDLLNLILILSIV